MRAIADPWLPLGSGTAKGQLSLLCFPYAGGGIGVRQVVPVPASRHRPVARAGGV